jgi:hypothetical protein
MNAALRRVGESKLYSICIRLKGQSDGDVLLFRWLLWRRGEGRSGSWCCVLSPLMAGSPFRYPGGYVAVRSSDVSLVTRAGEPESRIASVTSAPWRSFQWSMDAKQVIMQLPSSLAARCGCGGSADVRKQYSAPWSSEMWLRFSRNGSRMSRWPMWICL